MRESVRSASSVATNSVQTRIAVLSPSSAWTPTDSDSRLASAVKHSDDTQDRWDMWDGTRLWGMGHSSDGVGGSQRCRARGWRQLWPAVPGRASPIGRARIVLVSADRRPAQGVAHSCGICRPTVWRWQQSFAEAASRVCCATRRANPAPRCSRRRPRWWR